MITDFIVNKKLNEVTCCVISELIRYALSLTQTIKLWVQNETNFSIHATHSSLV
jgi:hypothetical protein